MAFPLGNYHNGAEDGSIAAEYIHRDDYLNGAALCTEGGPPGSHCAGTPPSAAASARCRTGCARG